jgi:hypothetical protein
LAHPHILLGTDCVDEEAVKLVGFLKPLLHLFLPSLIAEVEGQDGCR